MYNKTKPNIDTQTYPDNWSEVNLKSVVDVNCESLGIGTPHNFEFRYIDISSVTSGVIHWETVTTQIFYSSPSRARRVVRPNDVLLCTVRPGLQAHTFADWQESDGYICSTGFAVLRANESINPRFLYHLIFSEIVVKQIRQQEVGSNYPAVNEKDIKTLRLPLPPTTTEQQKIAEILDAIDKAIALTDTHITKLKKAKAGLLHDLLTRGIDDRGELRDYTRNPELFKRSALGIIPNDWEVESLESVCSNIVDCPHTTPIFRDEGVLIARTSNIRDGIFNISEVSYISEEDYTQRISRLKPQLGDVIFTREAPVGEAFVIPEKMRVCLGQRTMLLRPNPDKAIGDYIVAQVYSEIIKTRINQITGGTTNPHLNVADVRTFRVPFPKVYEQKRITDALKKQDFRIQQKAKLREKLKLLKKGLMSDLLTGRVRVKI